MPIYLVNERVPSVEPKVIKDDPTSPSPFGAEADKDEDDEEEEDEQPGPKFMVILSGPVTEGVKISKKNSCIVELHDSKGGSGDDEHEKLVEFFVLQENPSWSA